MREDKKQTILSLMKELQIKDSDLEEHFVLASGRGGQNCQKTSSCVHLKHLPTNIVIKCQATRERETNRFLARRQLCEKLQKLAGVVTSQEATLIKKIKQKKRRKRKHKAKENSESSESFSNDFLQ